MVVQVVADLMCVGSVWPGRLSTSVCGAALCARVCTHTRVCMRVYESAYDCARFGRTPIVAITPCHSPLHRWREQQWGNLRQIIKSDIVSWQQRRASVAAQIRNAGVSQT